MDLLRQSNLTKSQLYFWLGQKLNGPVPLYNVAFKSAIRGAVDPDHFSVAFQRLLDQADALRTVIEEFNGVPQQRVVAPYRYQVEMVDFSKESNAHAVAEAWMEQRARRGFNFAERLFDTALLKTGDEQYIWFMNQHHIICDGASCHLLFQRCGDLYRLSIQGKLDDAVSPTQFREYLAFDRTLREAPADAAEDAYWAAKLNGRERVALYGRTPPKQAGPLYRAPLALGQDRWEMLLRLAQRPDVFMKNRRVSVFNVMTAMILAYLHRIGAGDRLLIATPLHNRHSGFADRTIGICLGVLPLELRVGPRDTLIALAKKVGEEAASNLRHSRYYFHQSPLIVPFDVMVNYLTGGFARFGDLPAVSRWIPPGYLTESLAVTLEDFDEADTLNLLLDFNLNALPQRQCDVAASQFLHLADTLLQHPDRPVREVDPASAEEKDRVLVGFNRTEAAFPDGCAAHEIIEVQARKTPEATAVRYGDERLTYGELNRRANQLARYLQGLGVGLEDLVGIYVERSLEMAVGVLGVLKAGAAFLPLDPGCPAERLAFMLDDAHVRLLLTQQRLEERLAECSAERVRLDTDWARIARERDDDVHTDVGPSNLAYVIYTSGSTGRPKGVQIEHRGVCNLAAWQKCYFGLGPPDRVLQFATIGFDVFVWEMWMALNVGASLHLASRDTVTSPAALTELLREEGITAVLLPPTMLRLLSPEGLDSLHTVISGGEACSPELVKRWAEGRRFYNAYGPTEITVCATTYRCTGAEEHSVPIGRPVANTRLYVLDQALQPVALGMIGELYIGSDFLARGYINRPDLTAERFLPDPFRDKPGARMYKTGDLVRFLPDGNVEFCGRIDHQVKLRGFRIELGEIEALLGKHPGVRDVAVTLREDAPGDKRLVAYVVSKSNDLTTQELRSHLKALVPDYMVPSAFAFVEALPLTPSGKVDRRALPVPTADETARHGKWLPPRDNVEWQLAHIWEQLFDIRPIGATDDFFDLGGHSLLAVHLMDEIAGRFGQRLAPATLFEAPTIERLAGILRGGARADTDSPLVPIQPKGSRIPFFCVHPAPGTVFCYVEMARHLGLDQPFYGLQSFGVNGRGANHVRIEAMATDYVRAIRNVQPTGPYILGGHSSGGVIAYEMAQMLKKEGEKVALVVVIDSPAPLSTGKAEAFYDLFSQRLDDCVWLASIVQLAEMFFGVNLGVSCADLAAMTREEQLRTILKQLQEVGFIPPDAGPSVIQDLLDLCKANLRAALSYRAQPYDGPIAFLCTRTPFIPLPKGSLAPLARCAADLCRNHLPMVARTVPHVLRDLCALLWRGAVFYGLSRKSAMGWRRLSNGPLDIQVVPGDHITVLTRPHVEVMARELRKRLDQVQPRA